MRYLWVTCWKQKRSEKIEFLVPVIADRRLKGREEMAALENLLNKLWGSSIKKLEFDVLRNSITFELTTVDLEEATDYHVTFIGVSSHYYTRNNGASRLAPFSFEEGDYLELTSIDYFKAGVGEIAIHAPEKEWVGGYKASANFALEIWSALLFIEATSVRINDQYFSDLRKY